MKKTIFLVVGICMSIVFMGMFLYNTIAILPFGFLVLLAYFEKKTKKRNKNLILFPVQR